MNLLRKLLPLRFALVLGNLTILSATALDYDADGDDDDPPPIVSNTAARFGFAQEPVDEVGMTGLEPLEDEEDDDDEDPEDRAGGPGDGFGFAAAAAAGAARR